MKGLFPRFCAVGAIGLAVETAVFALTRSAPVLPVVLGKALAIEAAVLSNFALNNVWTFHENCGLKSRAWMSGCARYHLACLTGAVMNLGLFSALAALGLPAYAAHFSAVLLSALVNYKLCRRFVWASPPKI